MLFLDRFVMWLFWNRSLMHRSTPGVTTSVSLRQSYYVQLVRVFNHWFRACFSPHRLQIHHEPKLVDTPVYPCVSLGYEAMVN